MMANGKVISDKDMEYNYGQMEPNIKVNGKIIKHKEKVNLLMLMEIFIMEIGNKTKHLDMEYTYIITAQDMRVNG